jgi:hypothetical protein
MVLCIWRFSARRWPPPRIIGKPVGRPTQHKGDREVSDGRGAKLRRETLPLSLGQGSRGAFIIEPGAGLSQPRRRFWGQLPPFPFMGPRPPP